MSLSLSTAGLARASSRHPWRTIAVWILCIVLAAVASTGLAGALTTDGSLLEGDAVKGEQLLEERLRGPRPASETVIVRSDRYTVDDPAFRAVAEQTTEALLGLDGVIASAANTYQVATTNPDDAARMVSADRHTTIIPVTFAIDMHDAEKEADRYLDTLARNEADGIEVLSVGTVTVSKQFTETSEKDLRTGEGIGLLVALVILVVVFGALVAAGVPVVLALVSIFVAVGLTALLGQLMDLSFFVINMISMMGLAVGIDYSLFIVERYREERRRGATKHDAIAVAGGTASKAVLFSGMTVVLALAGMLMLPMTIFRSLGAGAILVVLVSIAASLTLIPAMLALLGDKIEWPRRRRLALSAAEGTATTVRGGIWARTTRAVMAHPVAAVIIAVVVLGAAALPAVDLRKSSHGAETLPPSEVKSAYSILERDFSAGMPTPVEIVVDAERTPQVEAGITRLVAALESDSSFVPLTSVQWNAAADLALVSVPLTTDSSSPEAGATIERLRGDIVPSAFAGDDVDVYVTGEAAFGVDMLSVIAHWTPIIFVFVLGLSFILLMLAFRSIVVPVKAILMNLLSVGAAYGMLVLVFQKGYGADVFGFTQTPTIDAWIPIFLFCVLFGLSMDYHVFLLSRIREHYDRTHDNRESVTVGLQSTARLITGAAAIMVVVFSGFAAGDLVGFQQMGFGLAVAVLLDATIVRSVLVPASMALLGNANWYLPRRLAWLPDLRVEGDAVHAPAVAPVAGDR
jgi:RND superfamily putative drug exporter